jgi:hypothetical protein
MCYIDLASYMHETRAYFSVRNTMVRQMFVLKAAADAGAMVNEPFYLTLSFIGASDYVTRFDSATLAQQSVLLYF